MIRLTFIIVKYIHKLNHLGKLTNKNIIEIIHCIMKVENKLTKCKIYVHI